MIEAAAFLATLAQMHAFSRNEPRHAWSLCLVCCALWLWVAVDKQVVFLAVQQFVFAGLALRALTKKDNNADRTDRR